MHNDFVHILFHDRNFRCSAFMCFYPQYFLRWTIYKVPERFLILTSVAALMMYSMTTLPMIYPGFQYVFFSVFSFALLEKEKKPDGRRLPTGVSSFASIPGSGPAPSTSTVPDGKPVVVILGKIPTALHGAFTRHADHPRSPPE